MDNPIPEPRSVACIMEAESKARKERAAINLEKRMRENVMMKANWCHQLKLASRYLGLQPVSPPIAQIEFIFLRFPPAHGLTLWKMKKKLNSR